MGERRSKTVWLDKDRDKDNKLKAQILKAQILKAQILKAQILKAQTASSFGYEWSRFGDMFAEYESNFLSYIVPLDREFLNGKLVLDAGCGAGRHAYFAAGYGAKIVAFDFSEDAVEAARRNLGGMPDDILVVQEDIYRMPEHWYGEFDYVMCIGVLHHLPDPRQGFQELVKVLRLGGTISVWVYGKQDNRMAVWLYEPLRKITTKIPHGVLYGLSFVVALGVEVLNRARLPLLQHYRRFPFRTKWNDAFDVLSAPRSGYYDTEEVREWFEQAGLKDIDIHYRILGGVAKGIIGVGVK